MGGRRALTGWRLHGWACVALLILAVPLFTSAEILIFRQGHASRKQLPPPRPRPPNKAPPPPAPAPLPPPVPSPPQPFPPPSPSPAPAPVTQQLPSTQPLAPSPSGLTPLSGAVASPPPAEPPWDFPPPGDMPPHAPASPPIEYIREANGFRLVGGSGPRGRLEIATTAAWVVGPDAPAGTVAWRPLCYDVSFTNDVARTVCNLMGYNYGRMYYTSEVAYREPNDTATEADMPLESLTCWDYNAPEWFNPPPGGVDGDGGSRRLRSLPEAQEGRVAVPRSEFKQCSFYSGSCDYSGPLVGIECSGAAMPPAPPPPPLPPGSPARPPSPMLLIRVVGGTVYFGLLELNLCPDGSQECLQKGRVELLVPDPTNPGHSVWAPVCAVPDFIANAVADVACKQAFDWPFTQDTWPVLRGTAKPPLPIPTGHVDPGMNNFDPASYSAWVTVLGGTLGGYVMQDLQLQVTKERCFDGNMLSVSCSTGIF